MQGGAKLINKSKNMNTEYGKSVLEKSTRWRKPYESKNCQPLDGSTKLPRKIMQRKFYKDIKGSTARVSYVPFVGLFSASTSVARVALEMRRSGLASRATTRYTLPPLE